MRPVTIRILYGVMFFIYACKSPEYAPKKPAYARINFPKKLYYTKTPKGCPFSVPLPKYSKIIPLEKKCWFNLKYPSLNVTLYFTFLEITDDYSFYVEDSRNFIMKHIKKATNITEKEYENLQKKVYGKIFSLTGPVASPVQFHISDREKYFLRGAMYYDYSVNMDSLEIVNNFVKEDIKMLFENLNWSSH